MFNIANVLHLFNNLVAEKYSDCTRDEPTPLDYETADQLMMVIELFMNSAQVLDGDSLRIINIFDWSRFCLMHFFCFSRNLSI
jgi:hypothetical protein